jgi:hypothetical protein
MSDSTNDLYVYEANCCGTPPTKFGNPGTVVRKEELFPQLLIASQLFQMRLGDGLKHAIGLRLCR